MAAMPPQLEGTETPSQIEFLWERYRRLIQVIVGAILVALLLNYGWQYMQQRETDSKWSAFAASIGLEKSYSDVKNAMDSLADAVTGMSAADLDKAKGSADAAQKPYVLVAIARQAMSSGDWARAEQALSELESQFPQHPLVKTNPYPVQVREVVKKEGDDADQNPNKKPELKPTKEGSVVSLMREQIAAAKSYTRPEQFAKVEPPADAKKVKFNLTGGRSFTIALMPQTPKHQEKFLELAKANFWVGIHVDEIQRPGEGFAQGLPHQLHLGYESTKDLDRTKWTTTDPSKNTVEFEATNLSHFPGAVSARVDADGKSAVDRFFVIGDDAARYDGERVVFGYIVEGLEAVTSICEEAMSAQEEASGRGKPSENIAVESIEVIGG
ncbi:MAG: hypothetical protein RLZZ303_265 [Candidatus Hydrogenedentota bacterium]|jgi:cyclophilin family peptidyl-prolyl cis-trans isomerase